MKIKQLYSKTFISLLIFTSLCYPFTACSKLDKNNPKEVSSKLIEDNTNEDTSKSISIKYIGNSCFYITFADGTRLVTDPYSSNYAATFGAIPEMKADVMTISHSHDDHISGEDSVTGNPKIIEYPDLDKTTVGDVEITAYKTRHVAEKMVINTIFVYKENGIKIVHMGETDNIDSKEAQDAIKDADVILAYAGELGTIKNKDSFNTLYNLNIKAIIPQHYSTDKVIYFNEPKIDQILTEIPEGTKVIKTNEFIVTKDLEKQFVVLSHMEN